MDPNPAQEPHPVQSQLAETENTEQVRKKSPRVFLIALAMIVLLILVGLGGFVLGSKSPRVQLSSVGPSVTSVPSIRPSISPVPTYLMPTPTPAVSNISGTLTKLSTDLQITGPSNPNNPTTYYEAGTFTSGKYAGYKRIIAVSPGVAGPGGGTEESCLDEVFLTKDEQQYIGNVDDFQSSSDLKGTKITQTAKIDYSLPNTIQIGNNFSLIFYNYGWLSYKKKNGNPPDCTLNSPQDKDMILLSTQPNYSIYSFNNLNNPLIGSDSTVVVIDKSGLPFEYQLSEEESHKYLAGTGPGQYATGEDNIFDYNDGGLRDYKLNGLEDSSNSNSNNFYSYEPGFNTQYPDYPRFVPDFSSLTASDFTPVSGINGNIPIYILSDSAAVPIYQTRYQKIAGIAQTYAGKPTQQFGNQRPFQAPTYAQYAQKHPFIFIKDYFGRFVMFEENQYITWHDPMVAGKPVIYLYPIRAENITVKLDFNGIITDSYPSFDSQIGGWKVRAYPDGHLVNSEDGLEYNYLFWEGLMKNENVDTSKGFVVAGPDTRSFLQEKLQQLGLTPKEYDEFIVYWIPKMQHNKYNYIKFLQNEYTENAKLTITPQPDSILRVFMAYKPLESKISVQPQALQSFSRKGFAVVEWGATELPGNAIQ